MRGREGWRKYRCEPVLWSRKNPARFSARMTSVGAGRQPRHPLNIYSHGFNACGAGFNRDFFTMLEKAFQIAADGIPDHSPRFFDGVALADESGQRGDRHNEPPFGGGFKDCRISILRHSIPPRLAAPKAIPALILRNRPCASMKS